MPQTQQIVFLLRLIYDVLEVIAECLLIHISSLSHPNLNEDILIGQCRITKSSLTK